MKTSNFFIFFIFLILNVGCDKPDPTPELKDMVYIELHRELADIQKVKDGKDKELQALKETLETFAPRSREKKAAWDRNYVLEKEIDKLEQSILYLQLRIHSRMEQDRKEYMEARRKGAVWPDPKAYDSYKLQRKLASAPKQWSRGRSAKAPAKKDEKAANSKKQGH